MASMALLFEATLSTTDERAFIFDANYIWTIEIVGINDSDCVVTVYLPTTGQTLGANTQWLIFNEVPIVAGGKVVEDQIFTPAGRDLRAYASVAGAVIRGYGVRL